MEENRIGKVISKLKWVFAKTMPHMPHWYTVRVRNNPELNELYETLYYYIRDNHYIKEFKGRQYKYCDIGDYTYWFMSEDINESKIINRAKKE